MLTWGTASTGHRVPKWNGRHLASSKDPVREAKDWVERRAAQLRGLKSILIIGVGGGFHVQWISHKFPKAKVLALDTNRELIQNLEEVFPELPNVESLYLSSAANVIGHDVVRASIQVSYGVLLHPSAEVAFADDAKSLFIQLLGREPNALHNLARTRESDGEFVASLLPEVFGRKGLHAVNEGREVSIKSLIPRLHPPFDDRARVWRALSELIR